MTIRLTQEQAEAAATAVESLMVRPRSALFVECCEAPGPAYDEECPDPDAYHVWSGSDSDRWWRKAEEKREPA